MVESLNRKIARRGGRAARDNTIKLNGDLAIQFVTHYSSINNLPGSANEGDMAYVSAANHPKVLYIYINHDGDPYTASGWYSLKIGAAA